MGKPVQVNLEKLQPQIRMMRLSELTAYDKNPRTHSEKQVDQIIASIREFGFTNPILVDSNFGIIAGHGRLRAAVKMKLVEVPVIVLSHLTDAQRRAYIIADNKLSLNAGWDLDLLSIAIQTLDAEGFDLELLGFSDEEFKDLNLVEKFEPGCDEDEVPDAAEAKTKPGDIYQLGRHRLMCGDSTSIDAVEKLMNGEKADMVFTDPPYGIDVVKGRLKGLGYREVLGDGNTNVAKQAIELITTLKPKVIIIWGGNYFTDILAPNKAWIVWSKKTSIPAMSDAELAWTNANCFIKEFEHQWDGPRKSSEKGQARIHPTQKPIALAQWCFEQYGKSGELVLDLFGGSGSTLIACEKTHRQCFMMEIDPAYCDQIITRWEKYAGQNAELIHG